MIRKSSLLLLGAALATPAFADGAETLGAPTLPYASGDVLLAGTGLHDAQPGTIAIEIPADADVLQVVAYWDGLDKPTDTQGDFDTVGLNGIAVTGSRIGGVTNFWAKYYASGYRADVTDLGLVGPGLNTITVEDLDFTYSNNGLSLVVILDDPETALTVHDGLDYAHFKFDSPYDAVVPMVYEFDPEPIDREATANLIIGGVGFERPSVIEVRVDGALTLEEIDLLDANAGPELDVHQLDFTVPAGATEVTIELFSEDRGGRFTGNLQCSLTWLFSGFELTTPTDEEFHGLDPHWWKCHWWRWDPWYTPNNYTTILLTDRFNDTFGVSPWESGMWSKRRLWAGLVGWGSWWNPMRRWLNREAVAALANADAADINYPFTVEEVKDLYRDAVGAIDGPETIESVLWIFYDANRLGCPF